MASKTTRFDIGGRNGARWYRLTVTEGSEDAGIAPAGALRDGRCILRSEADGLLATARADGLRVAEVGK